MNSNEIIPSRTDVGALANRINLETRQLHNSIDKLVTLKFAIAVRDPKIYRQGIQLFYHIFSAIEDSMFIQLNDENSKYTEMFKSIYKPEMLRREKLFDDLMFFYNDNEEKFSNPILTKQCEFVDYIKNSISQHPYLLLAYMHVLYLALFAGGRIMSSQVGKSLKLFPQVEGKSYEEIISKGTNFYRFDGYDSANMEDLRILYKRDYELATRNFLTEDEKVEVIQESKYIFQQVGECVKEIETHNIQRIKGKLMYHVMTKGYYMVISFLIVMFIWFLYRRLF